MDLESEATNGDMQGRGLGQRPRITGEQDTPNSTSSPHNGVQITPFARSGEVTLPEAYHLTSMDNYGLWLYRMSNILKRENLIIWYTTPAQTPILDMETRRREQVLSIINSNAKGTALRLMKRLCRI
jgi:hypothetical protein